MSEAYYLPSAHNIDNTLFDLIKTLQYQNRNSNDMSLDDPRTHMVLLVFLAVTASLGCLGIIKMLFPPFRMLSDMPILL